MWQNMRYRKGLHALLRRSGYLLYVILFPLFLAFSQIYDKIPTQGEVFQ